MKIIFKVLEVRSGVTGEALRIEKAKYCPIKGETTLGCPIAKYVLRRSTLKENYCGTVKHRTGRTGHYCNNQW